MTAVRPDRNVRFCRSPGSVFFSCLWDGGGGAPPPFPPRFCTDGTDSFIDVGKLNGPLFFQPDGRCFARTLRAHGSAKANPLRADRHGSRLASRHQQVETPHRPAASGARRNRSARGASKEHVMG